MLPFENPKFVRYLSRQFLTAQLLHKYWSMVDNSRGDYNDKVLRNRFLVAIEQIMKEQIALRNIAYFNVVCDESNNAASYIEAGGPPIVSVSWTETKAPEPVCSLNLGIPLEELI